MAMGFTDAKPQPHLVWQCWKPSHYRLWQQVKISEKLQQPYSPLKIAPTRWLGGAFWSCSQRRITDSCPAGCGLGHQRGLLALSHEQHAGFVATQAPASRTPSV